MPNSFLSRDDQARIIILTANSTTRSGWQWEPTIENGKPVIKPGSDIEITVDLIAALAHATGINGRGIACHHDAVHDATLVLRGQAQFIGKEAA